ncbi:MAG: lysophospholipid acyltransferase family protein [Bacteroidota bacterium]
MRLLAEPVYLLIGICAMIFFIVTVPLFFLAYVILFAALPEKKAPHAAHAVSRFWAFLLSLVMLIPARVKGKEKIDPRQTYVFVANHQSQLDIPLYALSCRNTFRFLAKAELGRIPLLGYVIRRLYLTVNRKDKADRAKSLQLMLSSIREGVSVFICPEGTRNRTSRPLLDFHDGAFRLAIEAQVPLAVLTVIDNRRRNSPKNPFSLRPGIMRAVWADPIPTTGLGQEDVPALKRMAYDIMLKNLQDHAKE